MISSSVCIVNALKLIQLTAECGCTGIVYIPKAIGQRAITYGKTSRDNQNTTVTKQLLNTT